MQEVVESNVTERAVVKSAIRASSERVGMLPEHTGTF